MAAAKAALEASNVQLTIDKPMTDRDVQRIAIVSLFESLREYCHEHTQDPDILWAMAIQHEAS
jgi:hypothetical protein